MKINQILSEQELNELSWKDIGKGIGRTAGAVGTGIGGVKGAVKGVKDAYTASRDKAAKSSQQTIGRAGGAKYPAKSTAPAQPTANTTVDAQPTANTTVDAQPTQVNTQVSSQVKNLRSQAALLNKQADDLERSGGASTQTTASDPTAPDANNMANQALGGLAGVIKGAQNAWERGARGPGEAWGSLADPGTGKTVKIKGNDNKNYQYTKQGTQWIDAQGNAVSDPAQIAMLNKQAAGQTQPATTTAPAAKTQSQEPITIGGQKILPSDPAYAKIMKGVGTTDAATAAPADTTATTTPPADTTAAEPVAKTRTGGKVAGQLSQTPSAIRRRQARAAASASKQASTGAFDQMANQLSQTEPAAPKFGPGVTPQTTVAPSKVSYNINLPKSPAAPAAVQTAGKINRGNPVVEQIDLAEVLWRKMKSKK